MAVFTVAMLCFAAYLAGAGPGAAERARRCAARQLVGAGAGAAAPRRRPDDARRPICRQPPRRRDVPLRARKAAGIAAHPDLARRLLLVARW